MSYYRTCGRKELPGGYKVYRLHRTNAAMHGLSNRTQIKKLRNFVFGVMFDSFPPFYLATIIAPRN